MSRERLVNGLSHLTNDQLDAIVTHAGSLLVVLHDVRNKDLIQFFTAELGRLEEQSCSILMDRGAILPVDFDEAI